MVLSFVKLPQCGGKTCFLFTQLKEEGREGFNLTLTDGDKFWTGQLTEEDLDALNSNLKMNFNTFVSETVMAFTRRKMGDNHFVYQLKHQADGVVDFVWKKEVGDIKILMGSVTLHQQAEVGKALTHLFTSCIDIITELQECIHVLEEDNQRLTQERENALESLAKCVSAKEKLEVELYSKFVAVLNSKKEKIRNLLEHGEPVPSTSGATSAAKNNKRVPEPTSSPPADSRKVSGKELDDKDTDDEIPAKKLCALTSKAANTDADSSLILGEDDDGDNKIKSQGVVRRPARQRGGNKHQTPVKPVLPKVPPGSKTSKGSLRKSGSGNTDRSVENVDTDDLLNDF